MKEDYYFIYLVAIITTTVILSLSIIRQSTKTGYMVISPIVGNKTLFENESKNCPCKNIGEESSECSIYFLKESDNAILENELRPNYEQIFDGFGICIPPTIVKINSYGLRDYEYSLDKPHNTFRIVAVGDSITFGHGVELNETYSKILEKLLNEKNIRRNYEVLNFGVPGYNIVEKVEFFRIKAMQFNPDLIIFQYLGDDIVNWSEFRKIENGKIEEFSEEAGIGKENLTDFELQEIHNDTYQKYLNELMEKQTDEVLSGIEQSFEELHSMTQNKIGVLLIFSGVDKDQISLLKKVSNSYGWLTLDMKELLSEYPQHEIEIDPKDPHPNAFANELIAKALYRRFSYITSG